jgi:hypothetical protein
MRSTRSVTLALLFTFLCSLSTPASAQPDVPAKPNVVLNTAVHFTGLDGRDISVGPGQYFVDQSGASALRLTPVSGGRSLVIQAQSSRHEQYELFSAIALTRPGKKGEVHVALLLPGGQRLEAVGSLTEPPRSTERVKPQKALPPEQSSTTNAPVMAQQAPPASIMYVPPVQGAPGGRVGAATRGMGQRHPDLWALCPDHTGLTAQEQPILYWYASQPLKTPVDIRLVEPGASHPHFEARLVPPVDAGFQSINLSDYGIRLAPEVPYQWFVSLMGIEPGKEVTIGGTIMRVPLEGPLSAELVRAEKLEVPRLYAKAGLWYDAVSTITDLIQADPRNAGLSAQRLSLFDQVGLSEVTTHLRGEGASKQ